MRQRGDKSKERKAKSKGNKGEEDKKRNKFIRCQGRTENRRRESC